jgi:hypothetical protein
MAYGIQPAVNNMVDWFMFHYVAQC